MEKYLAERLKCKPPKKVEVARVEPVEQVKPESGSTDTESDFDSNEPASRSSSPEVDRRSPLIDSSSLGPVDNSRFREPLTAARPQEPAVDLDALKDRYRPKEAKKPSNENDTKPISEPTGTILLEPIRPPTPPMEEIKVEPITPIYVEMKKPLKSK